jgi:hypothetical protein
VSTYVHDTQHTTPPSLLPACEQSKPDSKGVDNPEAVDSNPKWAPFIVSFDFSAGGPASLPVIRAAGANMWSAKADFRWLDGIVASNFELKGMRGLHVVEAPPLAPPPLDSGAPAVVGDQLMLVSPVLIEAFEIFYQYDNTCE